MMKKSADIWILISVFALLFVGGYFLATPKDRKEFKMPTTYNADPQGVKAFYTLLGEKLDYKVSRLKSPYTKISRAAKVLIVVQPLDELRKYGIKDNERKALIRWVKKGGVVIFLSDELEGVPAVFGSDQEMDRGYVYAFNSKRIITNKGMRNYRNAVKLLGIIDKHASKHDLILFDEYHHGDIERRSIWSYVSRQVWIAFGTLIIAGSVLCYSRGRRFGAVRNLPVADNIRPGYEFVESVARLYQRAHATDLAADILCKSFKNKLCTRLGMPSDAARERIAIRLESDIGGDMPAKIDKLFADCESFGAGQKPTEQELLDMARKIHQLEKELGLGSIEH